MFLKEKMPGLLGFWTAELRIWGALLLVAFKPHEERTYWQ